MRRAKRFLPPARARPFATLRGYRRAWALGDAGAAVTLLAVALPAQLATARLAQMPPITGFYAFIAGTAMFALLGSNPQLSVGADSTIAPLFAAGITHLAPVGSPRYVDLVGILAVEVGALVALVWLLRLGWIAEFLSTPIITGFLGGIAVVIVVHELPELLGIPATSGGTLQRLAAIINALGRLNGPSLAIGTVVFALALVVERLDRRLPGALVGLAASTAAVELFKLRSRGVAVLGSFAHGTPRLGLTDLSLSALGRVAPIAAVVALVVVSQSAATTRAFADRGGYEVDVARDLLGVGVGSVAAGLLGAFPVDASPPGTATVAAASGRTQAAGLGAAAAMAALIPFAGVLRDVPLATLAGVLMFIATRIFHAGELVAIARFSLVELGLALIALLAVSLIGVEEGIGVAVGLAILDRARRSARPQLHVLGRIPGTTSWAPISSVRRARQQPGVLVVLFATPLWYANASHFRTQLHRALARAVGRPRVVVLDAIGMGDIDYTGVRALSEALDELDRRRIGFALARAGEHLRAGLARSGLLQRIGEHRLFASVDEAVSTLLRQPATPP